MAKKKRKTTHRRRRRVGAMKLNGKNMLIPLAGAALGCFVLNVPINNGIDKLTGTMNKKVIGAGELGAGAALVFVKFGKKQIGAIQTFTGGVVAGAGLRRLLSEFGIMNGFQNVPVVGYSRPGMAGYGAVPALGNYKVPSPMNGALNGVFNGYQVPKVPSGIIGSTGGSTLSNGSIDFMD